MSHSMVVSIHTQTAQAEAHLWYLHLVWVLAAGALGFVVAAVFAGLLRLPRVVYLVPYTLVAGTFVYSYFRWSQTSVADLIRRNWPWGLLGALVCGVFTVKNILSQPASPRSDGLALALDLVWSGAVYGTLDALLLSVIPVLAVWNAFGKFGWANTWPGKIGVGLLALIASLLVTAAYHAGYPEFRGPAIAAPAIGNGALTLGYLITNNPLSAILGHVAMHIAGVLHGPAGVAQLPPHY